MDLDSSPERRIGRWPSPDQPPADGTTPPPYAFMALGFLVASVVIVALLGAALARGVQFGFDRAIILHLRVPGDPAMPLGPDWLRQMMVDVTALGGKTVLTMAVVLAVGVLLASRHLLTAALVAGGTAGGSLAVQVAKALVARERPALVDHLVEVGSASFPSAHAANSAIIYLTLALAIMPIAPTRAARRVVLGAAIALMLLIGSSRVYLGVHWPSDVLAGWVAGTSWALAWWAVGCWLHRAPTSPGGA